MKTVKLRQFTDDRGSLVENTLASIMDSSKHFFISKSKPGVIRGNHYHKHKSEWFYIIQGTCKMIVKDMNTGTLDEKIIKDTDNFIVYVLPDQVHAFENVGKNEMILIALVNEVLDHDNPDTYRYKIM